MKVRIRTVGLLVVVFAVLGDTVPVIAGNLVSLTDSPTTQCNGLTEYCHEWRIEGVPGIRIVSSGYEDGGDEEFDKLGAEGLYTRILTFSMSPEPRYNGVVEETEKIRTIPFRMGPKGLEVWATFDHDFTFDGVNCYPAWQRRIPAVLAYLGDKRPRTLALHYRLMSLSELVRQAHIAVPGSNATVPNCRGECC